MYHSIDSEKKIIPFIPEGDFYFSKGVEAFQKHKFEVALKWFNKAVTEQPDNPLYKCQMSIVYTEVGSYHLANQVLTEVLATHGEKYPDCYYLLANNYAHLGLLQDAVKHAELYLEKTSDGDFQEDAKSLLDVLDFNDEDEEDWALDEEDDLLMYQETAFYHLEREEWEEAIVTLEHMIALFPHFSQARHEYHYALFFAGEQEEAIELEEKYAKDNPDNLYSQMNLTIFYYQQGKTKRFQELLTMLENIFPIHEQQKLRLATTFAQVGMYQKAFQRFRLLHKSQLKGHPSYYRWFSTCYYYLDKQEYANALWKEGCQRHTILSKQAPPWERN
ncbi:tetratricopeptide repeat protein [Gracilibacillus sp. YIM 98692]|uniref:tetratricopeptide repeat protein n=1 Tax=Gracilibacillus sp. YIM 98692 TaxID=2663532 RepID=UPI0013D069DE|nr:tetratricopeptide repeat protein [Gracilibacillus sp. YIM 98692]